MKPLMKIMTVIVTGLFAFSVQAESAADWSKLKAKKQTDLGLYMTPNEAYTHMQKNSITTLFVDVRSRPEVSFLGMPTIVTGNVPYMKLSEWYSWNAKKKNFDMEVNSEFAITMAESMKAKGLSKDDTVILICRSGSRSSKAVNLLAKLGYTNVYSIPEGYEGDKSKAAASKGHRVVNGWKNAGLPWSYKLEVSKMYQVGD